MTDFKLNVKIQANFDWKNPPASPQEKAMRAQLDAEAAALAARLDHVAEIALLGLFTFKRELTSVKEEEAP